MTGDGGDIVGGMNTGCSELDTGLVRMMSRSWRSTWNRLLAEKRLHRSVQEGDGGGHSRREEGGGCDSWWTTHWVTIEIGRYTKLLATFRHGKGEEYKNKNVLCIHVLKLSHILSSTMLVRSPWNRVPSYCRSLTLSHIDVCPRRLLHISHNFF